MERELGDKVKLLRNRRGLKQDDLAEVLELSRSQISNLESGRRNISLKQLEKLCEYFKVDISYFIMSETNDACLDLIEKGAYRFCFIWVSSSRFCALILCRGMQDGVGDDYRSGSEG